MSNSLLIPIPLERKVIKPCYNYFIVFVQTKMLLHDQIAVNNCCKKLFTYVHLLLLTMFITLIGQPSCRIKVLFRYFLNKTQINTF